jgi:predicted membrane channel-forming protein YqfA (hemolysin III family)
VTSAYASIGLACAFLALLFFLHILKPELDPAWRWISEYEIGRFGWMMRLAFFCWGGSVLALAVTLWPSLQPVPGILGGWWLIVIAVALVGAGIFKTNAITDRTNSRENALHALCGAVVILSFPIVATLVAVSLFRGAGWSASHGRLMLATALTWVGLVVFLVSDIWAGSRSPSAERVGDPDVRVGWQNRFMVVAYAIWIVVVSAASLRL